MMEMWKMKVEMQGMVWECGCGESAQNARNLSGNAKNEGIRVVMQGIKVEA